MTNHHERTNAPRYPEPPPPRSRSTIHPDHHHDSIQGKTSTPHQGTKLAYGVPTGYCPAAVGPACRPCVRHLLSARPTVRASRLPWGAPPPPVSPPNRAAVTAPSPSVAAAAASLSVPGSGPAARLNVQAIAPRLYFARVRSPSPQTRAARKHLVPLHCPGPTRKLGWAGQGLQLRSATELAFSGRPPSASCGSSRSGARLA